MERLGDGEMGEIGRWRDWETERLGDWEMERWERLGDGEIGRWRDGRMGAGERPAPWYMVSALRRSGFDGLLFAVARNWEDRCFHCNYYLVKIIGFQERA
jgi:hypothetical protein